MKLEHVNMTVRDLDRSVDFYCSLLGGRIRWRGQNSVGRAAVHVGTESSYLALFQASESTVHEPLPSLDSAAPGVQSSWIRRGRHGRSHRSPASVGR